ncbi:uncharacterized protein BKA55DRAFT_349105 [Fusarium redolens]|jgi:murein tripeptide amidase MpaA|uniref:Uncharacterized protein n=1 Tax=Fusarium redolens TaxID=48865 RepID=A0A9P9HA45_FUSRE|nr:uncharacterized protein BKA55DRAFT_349105 [Fusarium redolens]KAH7253969.1 hypothetical protein BKA55DRAFT_349105 [Fusarium redolens]
MAAHDQLFPSRPCDILRTCEPLTHSEIYHQAPWFISIFVQGREIIAQYSPRHTSNNALVDVAVHHHGDMI